LLEGTESVVSVVDFTVLNKGVEVTSLEENVVATGVRSVVRHQLRDSWRVVVPVVLFVS